MTGEIAGVPTSSGNYSFTARLRDQSGAWLDGQISLSVGGASQPLGWMAPADWEQTLKLMKEYQELVTDLAPTSFYSNGFVLGK